MQSIEGFQNFIAQTQKTGSNPSYTPKVSLEQEPDQVNISNKNTDTNKKMSAKKKILIGVGAGLTALGAAACVLLSVKKGKLKPANFSEFIEFRPAETMEEARKFAMENFKIKKYDLGDNLEVANWFNEGLTNLNNQFKGKAHMPRSIKLGDLPEGALARVGLLNDMQLSRKLLTDKEGVKKYAQETIGLFFDTNTNGVKLPPGVNKKMMLECINEYKKLLKSDNSTVIDWLNLGNKLDDVFISMTNPSYVLSLISKDKDCVEILKKENISLDLAKIFSKSNEEQVAILDNVLNTLHKKTGKKIFVDYPGRYNTPFSAIYHELGHIQHHKNMSFFERIFKDIDPEFTRSVEKQQIAQKVSWYATTTPEEYVAEVFTKMCEGCKIPDETMALYKQYNGFCP